MKRLKFRAWNKEAEKIVGWDDIKNHYNLLAMLDPVARDYGKYIVMQYTGLIDTNGIEIYEGDIVRVMKYDNIAEIEYDGSSFRISQYDRGYGITLKTIIDEVFEDRTHRNLTVIGDIYSNPELLNKTRKQKY